MPPPEIKWTKSGGQKLHKDRMQVLQNGALKINRMKYEDDGQYVCTAENVFGSNSSEVLIRVVGAGMRSLHTG